MSFLSGLINAVSGGFEGNTGTSGALARELLQRFQQNQGGGLAGLVDQLSKKGLGDVVQSWVGSGPNKEVTPDQLSQSLDKNLLEQPAAKLGIPPQMVATHLAEVLPKIVDRLTPDGKLPTAAPDAGDFASES
ncbi:MAG: YidB family protein [Thermoguttaceae bacterium]|jgi:uncharacterized protein YidB (DUF937 family)